MCAVFTTLVFWGICKSPYHSQRPFTINVSNMPVTVIIFTDDFADEEEVQSFGYKRFGE